AWGEAVETNLEEAGVESLDRGPGGQLDVGSADRRGICGVPGLVAPLLEKVRVAGSLVDDALERLDVDRLSGPTQGCGDGLPRRLWAERSYLREVEEALGVRLGF